MHILQINKFFYRRGGVETVFFDTIDGLRARGHEVSEFSMMHPNNLPSEYDAYFASQMPELLGKQDLKTKFKILTRLFYSSEVKKSWAPWCLPPSQRSRICMVSITIFLPVRLPSCISLNYRLS